MRFITSKKIALSYKIYSLALLGIIGLIAGVAGNLFIAGKVEQVQKLQMKIVDVQLFMKDEAFLRASYLTKLDDKLKGEIVSLSKNTETSLEEILAQELNEEINSELSVLIADTKKKSLQFKVLGKTSKELEDNKVETLSLYAKRDSILQEVSAKVDEQETESMMYGSDFKEVKKSLRVFYKDYLSSSSNYFIALNELIIFKDKDKYIEKIKSVNNSVRLTKGNIKSLIGAIDEKYFTDSWNKVLALQSEIDVDMNKTLSIWEQQQEQIKSFTKIEEEMIKGLNKVSDSLSLYIESFKNRLELLTYILVAILTLVMIVLSVLVARPLVSSLNAMAITLGDLSKNVLDTSSDLKDTSNDLSDASERQASSVQETVASLDEISAMVESNVDNSQKSSSLTESLAQAANHSKNTVEEVKSSISEVSSSNDEIMEQMNNTNEEMTRITEVISNIGEKTKVINDIVFQTKLLSFNASVEAARAGEHGKGFAVVAEEVGNLAQMSGSAADEISDLLNQSIQNVEQMVEQNKSRIEKLILSGKAKVKSSAVAADQSANALDKILAQVQNVKEMTAQVAEASKEQSIGINEINNAMGLIDQTTKENSISAADSANYAQDMNSKALSLQAAVGDLLEIVNGGSNMPIKEDIIQDTDDSSGPGIEEQLESDDNFESIA